jgi:pyruvate dehydrogenase E2 component (dihydrolipoamide acetyltransferase)
MTAMRDQIARVRSGRFRARELSDATITLTSLGDRLDDRLCGVIYPPQIAIVRIVPPLPFSHGSSKTKLRHA